MKRTSRVLAILLALAMLLSVTAFAAWDVYGGNDNHNSVVTNAPTTATTTALNSYIDLSNGGRGWDGIDNVPVMETVDGVTYAYVLYDGYSSYGGQLAKINCSAATPYVVWHKQISAAAGFQLSTPYLDTTNRAIYIGASNASVYNNVAISSPVALTAGTAGTVTINGLTLLTAANRVSVPVYVGHTSVADRGTIATEGTATIQLGSNADKAVSLTLSTTQSSSGTIYKIYEQATYDDDGNVNGYDYYYYINHSVSADTTETENVTLSISVTLNGTGTIESVSMFANKGAVTKVSGIDSTDASGVTLTSVVSSVNGQINTPIMKYDGYIYFGTWSGNNAMQYYQVKVSDSSFTAKTMTGETGFYWAGAVKFGNYIYFGGDANSTDNHSYLYYRRASAFGTSGGKVALPDGTGNIRSTIMTDGEYLYFTSQDGYLWCYKPNATTGKPVFQWSAALGGTSTSAPTKVGDRIYVGVYSGFNKGGVKCVSASTHAVKDVIAIADKNNFPVQCSIVVKGNGTGTDYLFFNTNSGSSTTENANYGCGYCYSYDGTTATQQWASRSDTYALGGMACDNGIIVFGNDYDHLYVVK